jgi:hypothetical protein
MVALNFSDPVRPHGGGNREASQDRWVEWGPGDHSFWLYGLEAYPEDSPAVRNLENRPEMMAVRRQAGCAAGRSDDSSPKSAGSHPSNSRG